MLTITKPADRELLLTRTFNAPRELVFKVMTDPALISKWWGPRAYATRVDKMDFRPGGQWRFLHRGPDGNEYGFNGVYREITPPERLVYTFEFEGMPGHVSTEHVTFEEHDGKTTIKNRVVFDSVEDRDGMLNSGMETGATETMDRLEELIATMQEQVALATEGLRTSALAEVATTALSVMASLLARRERVLARTIRLGASEKRAFRRAVRENSALGWSHNHMHPHPQRDITRLAARFSVKRRARARLRTNFRASTRSRRAACLVSGISQYPPGDFSRQPRISHRQE